MLYALVSSFDDTGIGCHRLFFGTLPEIAQSLVDQCSGSALWEDIEYDESSLEEYAEDDGDLDSLCSIYENPNPKREDVENFDFYYSGEHVQVIALTDSYAALVDAFNDYAKDAYCSEYRMLPGDISDPDILKEIDDDLINLFDRPSVYFKIIEYEKN